MHIFWSVLTRQAVLHHPRVSISILSRIIGGKRIGRWGKLWARGAGSKFLKNKFYCLCLPVYLWSPPKKPTLAFWLREKSLRMTHPTVHTYIWGSFVLVFRRHLPLLKISPHVLITCDTKHRNMTPNICNTCVHWERSFFASCHRSS